MSRGDFVKCDQCGKLVEAYQARLWAKLELPIFEGSEDMKLYLQSYDSCSFECTRRIIEYSEDQGRKYIFFKKSKELKNTIIEEIYKYEEEAFPSEQDALNALQMIVAKHSTSSNGLDLEKQPRKEPYKQYYRIYYKSFWEQEREDQPSFPVLLELSHNQVRVTTNAMKETV